MKIERSTLLVFLVILIVGFFVIYPLIMVFYGSFSTASPGAEGHFTWEGYTEAYSNAETWKTLWTTLWLGLVRTFITAIIAVFFAWVVTRTDTPFRGGLEFLLWINFFLPQQAMIMAWTWLLAPKHGFINQALMALPFIEKSPFNIYSYGGIIWASLFFATSIRFLMLTPAFRRMDASLEESSRMSGASTVTTFWRITLPLMMPAVMATMLLGFIKVLESFEVELFLGYREGIFVYTTRVYDLVHWLPPKYPQAMALSVVFMLVVFVLVFINRWVIGKKQYVTVTGRGFAVRPMALGRWKYVTLIISLLFIVTGTFLPLATLVLGTFMKIAGVFLPDPFTTEHYREVLRDPLILPSLKNSLIVGLGVAVVGVLVYSLISYLIIRTKLAGRGTLDFISWLPWSVPGMVLALGFLWAFVGGIPLPFTLYGTLWIMMLAFVVRELPLGVRSMNAVMYQISKELEESSRVHGASWFRTFRSIIMPLISPAFVSVGIILFLLAIRDLVTVVLLYTPSSRVLSLLMFEYWFGGWPEKGAVIGLILTVVVILAAAFARWLGSRMGGEVQM